MDERVAQYLHMDFYLFWPIVGGEEGGEGGEVLKAIWSPKQKEKQISYGKLFIRKLIQVKKGGGVGELRKEKRTGRKMD